MHSERLDPSENRISHFRQSLPWAIGKTLVWVLCAVVPAAFLTWRALRIQESISLAGAIWAVLVIAVGLGSWSLFRRAFAPNSWNPKERHPWIRTVALWLTLFVLLILASHLILDLPPEDGASSASLATSRIGVVVDAGSSNTRAFVYRWEKTEGGGPKVELVDSKKAPTWSSTASGASADGEPCIMAGFDKNDGCECLTALLEKVFQETYTDADGRIDLWIGATGGVRLMKPDKDTGYKPGPEAPQTPQDRAIRRARGCVDPKRFNLGDVRVLNGTEEGAYAWLAVNDLRGSLGRPRSEVGIVEIGGASAQAAQRQPAPNLALDKGKFEQLTLGGEEIELWSLSLDMGKDAARREITPEDPTICDNGTSVADCRNKISAYLKEKFSGNGTACKAGGEFVALATPAYTMKNFQLDVNTASLHDLVERAEEVCGQAQEEDVQTPSLKDLLEDIPKAHQKDLCFSAFYSHLLTKEGLDLDPRQVTPLLNINGEDISWTRGAMLIEAQRLLDAEAAAGGPP